VIFLSSAVMALAVEMATQRWPARKDHSNTISIKLNSYQKLITIVSWQFNERELTINQLI
jgi:hypothetical protein